MKKTKPSIAVSDARGVRTLHVGGEAIQSAMRIAEPFALHSAAAAVCDAPHFEFQNNQKSCARQVTKPAAPAGRTTPSGPVRNNRKPFF